MKSDSSEHSLVSVLEGQDAVVNVVGTGGFDDYQKRLIHASAYVGVKRYIPSDFGADTQNPRCAEICPIFSRKEQALEYLKQRGNYGDTFTWTSIASGAFLDWVS